MEKDQTRDASKYSTVGSGVRYVMIAGACITVTWLVVCLAIQEQQMSRAVVYTQLSGRVEYGWTMSAAKETKDHCFPVVAVTGGSITVI